MDISFVKVMLDKDDLGHYMVTLGFHFKRWDKMIYNNIIYIQISQHVANYVTKRNAMYHQMICT